jgi:O-antigen ligase
MNEIRKSGHTVSPLVHGGLYLLVASIPFEYPDRTIPLEIPTLTASLFLLGTMLHPGRCYGRLPAPVVWFGAYLLVYGLAMLVGGEHVSEAVSELIIVLQGALVLLAAGNLLREEQLATRTMLVFVAACSVRAALPLLGFARTANTVWTGGERISALGQNANSAAMILAAGMVALIGLAYSHRYQTRLGLLLTAVLGALLGFAVLETGSRGGLLSLVGGVLVFALAAPSLRARLRNMTIGLLAISLLVAGALQLPVMKNRWEDSVRTGNLAGREQLYPALWTMFLEKPVLGWGPVTNTYELAERIGERERSHRAAHNILLELLTATGIVGALPFLIGGWLCARQAWRARSSSHGVLPLALLFSVFLSNMSGDWIASKLIWVVLAITYASGQWARVSTALPASAPAPAPGVRALVPLVVTSQSSRRR